MDVINHACQNLMLVELNFAPARLALKVRGPVNAFVGEYFFIRAS